MAALALAVPTPWTTVAHASGGQRQVPSSRATTVDHLADDRTTTGCTTTAYCPQDLVTRDEMFTFLQRLGSATS